MATDEKLALSLGSRGAPVMRVQQRLLALGYSTAPIDGVYGPETHQAVGRFQLVSGLDVSGDLTAADHALLMSDNARPNTEGRVQKPIDVAEVQQQLAVARAALAADNQEARLPILCDGLLSFGMRWLPLLDRFRQEAPEQAEALGVIISELELLMQRWLLGDTLTSRADEPERRAALADDMLTYGGRSMTRIAATTLLELPEGHPRRDVGRVVPMLEREIQRSREIEDWQQFLVLATVLFEFDVVGEPAGWALLEEVEKVHQTVEELTSAGRESAYEMFARAAARWNLAHASNDDLDAGQRRRHTDSGARFLQSIESADHPLDPVLRALALEKAGDALGAAQALAVVVDARARYWETAAYHEGMLRLSLDQPARSAEVLSLIIDHEEQSYLLALHEADIDRHGDSFSKTAVGLASAYACLGRWSDATLVLDRAKSARVRHAVRLRSTTEGAELLRLEAKLAASRRGVPGKYLQDVDPELDPMGARVNEDTRLLEQYRKVRPALAADTLIAPSVRYVTESLDQAEAVVCLGYGPKGLLMSVMRAGDGDIPGWSKLFSELDQQGVSELFLDLEARRGWVFEMAASEPVDPEGNLDDLLERVDAAFGAVLAAVLSDAKLGRVTIVPHRLLHLVPFWAVPSLRAFDVRVAPSLAQWSAGRGKLAALNARAAIVGDPTLDLPLAVVEAEALARWLRSRGHAASPLIGADAQEDAIRDAARGAGLLHFAGHGRARPSEPLLTALLVHPDPHWQWPNKGDPFQRLMSGALAWHDTRSSWRYADVKEGRLLELLDAEAQVIERRIEHSEQGTLWGSYQDGELIQLAELWTTADLLIENDVLEHCALAYLGACESGRGAFAAQVDEGLGLPSALEMAGVKAIVCSLWPIEDAASLLFAHLFYERLLEATAEPCDVGAAVRAGRAQLAGLTKQAAIGLLEQFCERTTNLESIAELDATIAELREGSELPFSHPYVWAAFTNTGHQKIARAPGIGRYDPPYS